MANFHDHGPAAISTCSISAIWGLGAPDDIERY
jgi:hypothetical protein